jgi:hypothetical protein
MKSCSSRSSKLLGRSSQFVLSTDMGVSSYTGIPAAIHSPLHQIHHKPDRSKSLHLLSKLSNASVGSDIRLDLGSGLSSRNNSTRELGKQISIALTKSTRTSQRISFTSATESRTTRRAFISRKEFSSKRRRFHGCLDIFKHISLCQNVTALANFEGVA